MRVLFSLSSAVVIFCSTAVFADATDVRPYVAINAGMVFDTDSTLSSSHISASMSTKQGYAVTGAVGLDFERVRVEAEIGYRATDFDTVTDQGTNYKVDGTTHVVSYMLNGHLTVPSHAHVKPFITGGIGIATAYWSDQRDRDTGVVEKQASRDTQLAYQVGIGASYEATRNISFDGTYRYFGTTDFDITGVNASYGSHNVMLGVRYRF